MSQELSRHPGLNLGAAHGGDHDAAESLLCGFWMFLMSDAILFGLAFASYGVLRSGVAEAPGPEELYEIGSVFVQTMLLLASSFTFGMASLALKYRHATIRLLGWLVLTLLLGIGFLGLELNDFNTMIESGGAPSHSGFLSAFFGLVPLHGLHVTCGCIWMLALFGQMLRYGIDRGVKLGLMRLALFWHFLDIIWIGIFTVVYLAGLA